MQATDLVFRKPFQTLFISFKGVNTCTPHVPGMDGFLYAANFHFVGSNSLDAHLIKNWEKIHCSMFNSIYMSKNKFSHSLNFQIYARLEYLEQYNRVGSGVEQ